MEATEVAAVPVEDEKLAAAAAAAAAVFALKKIGDFELLRRVDVLVGEKLQMRQG